MLITYCSIKTTAILKIFLYFQFYFSFFILNEASLIIPFFFQEKVYVWTNKSVFLFLPSELWSLLE